jgi:dTDP-4-amino-4,6-dideoxygalactose transaminase
MGTAGIYSFFPAKNLGALGDGGAVVTNDKSLASKIEALRVHGAKKKYKHIYAGGNFRLDTLQAAFLSVKLPFLKKWEKQRREVAGRYNELFKKQSHIITPKEPKDVYHVFNQYVIQLPADKRDKVKQALKRANTGCAVYYPVPLHLQPCFSQLGYKKGSFLKSEQAADSSLALPADPLLNEEEIKKIGTIVINNI